MGNKRLGTEKRSIFKFLCLVPELPHGISHKSPISIQASFTGSWGSFSFHNLTYLLITLFIRIKFDSLVQCIYGFIISPQIIETHGF